MATKTKQNRAKTERRLIDRAHDLEALQVALSALLRGYRIFREPYAKRIDTDVDDLDERRRHRAQLARGYGRAASGPPTRRRGMTNGSRTQLRCDYSASCERRVGLSHIIFLGVED